MNAEQRKAELKRIQETTQPCMTGITLTYYGERKTFNAYRIPLSMLTYNPPPTKTVGVDYDNDTLFDDAVKLIDRLMETAKHENLASLECHC